MKFHVFFFSLKIKCNVYQKSKLQKSFSFCDLQSSFSGQRHQEVKVKTPCRYQLELPRFNVLCRCSPKQWSPAVSFQRLTFCHSISLGCLGISLRLLQPTIQSNNLKPCLATKVAGSDSISSFLMQPHLDHPHRFLDVFTDLISVLLPNSSSLSLQPPI